MLWHHERGKEEEKLLPVEIRMQQIKEQFESVKNQVDNESFFDKFKMKYLS